MQFEKPSHVALTEWDLVSWWCCPFGFGFHWNWTFLKQMTIDNNESVFA